MTKICKTCGKPQDNYSGVPWANVKQGSECLRHLQQKRKRHNILSGSSVLADEFNELFTFGSSASFARRT